MERDGGSQETVEATRFPFSGAVEAGPLGPAEDRLVALIEEFRRRQRKCPNLVVRPWWSPGPAEAGRSRVGFVVEYCPNGRESVELQVRAERVTVEGPAGWREASLELASAWVLDGDDVGSPETLANHLLRLADGALGGAA